MTIDQIIEALEKATGPDRYLDARIYLLATPEGQGVSQVPGHDPEHWIVRVVENPTLRKYTSSIDAALTLVPEGWGFKAECGLGYGNEFTVGHVGKNNLYDVAESYGKAATPALALCIAALKARRSCTASSDKQHHKGSEL